MKKNEWKEGVKIVYWRKGELRYEVDEEEEEGSMEGKEEKVRVRMEKKGGGGKRVRVIWGFMGWEDDLKEVGRVVKRKCGVGGGVKEGEIVIEGELKEGIMEVVKGEGLRERK